jgi:hypothetical protein
MVYWSTFLVVMQIKLLLLPGKIAQFQFKIQRKKG